MSIDISSFFVLFLMVRISLPYQRMGRTSALYTFILETSGGNFAYKCYLDSHYMRKFCLFLLNILFTFIGNLLIIFCIKKESLNNCKLNKHNFTLIAKKFMVFSKYFFLTGCCDSSTKTIISDVDAKFWFNIRAPYTLVCSQLT
jgi:hypothetical protein